VTVSFSATYIALWFVVIFEGLLILSLLQQLTKLRRLAEQGGSSEQNRLALGSKAPPFAGIDLHSGEQIGIAHLDRRGGLVIFLSPDCSVCKSLVGSVALSNELPQTIAFCQGSQQACTALLTRVGVRIRSSFTGAEEAITSYRVSGFPTAVVVDGERRIRAYGYPKDAEDLKALFARGLSDRSHEAVPEEESSMIGTSLR
jgi:hypothetical protein